MAIFEYIYFIVIFFQYLWSHIPSYFEWNVVVQFISYSGFSFKRVISGSSIHAWDFSNIKKHFLDKKIVFMLILKDDFLIYIYMPWSIGTLKYNQFLLINFWLKIKSYSILHLNLLNILYLIFTWLYWLYQSDSALWVLVRFSLLYVSCICSFPHPSPPLGGWQL